MVRVKTPRIRLSVVGRRCSVATIGALATATAVGLFAHANAAGQTPGLKTPWGTPDLQGIWANMQVVPFERPKQFGTREFKTDEEMNKAELELIEAKVNLGPRRDSRTRAVGSEKDVALAYNQFWLGERLTTLWRRARPTTGDRLTGHPV